MRERKKEFPVRKCCLQERLHAYADREQYELRMILIRAPVCRKAHSHLTFLVSAASRMLSRLYNCVRVRIQLDSYEAAMASQWNINDEIR